jgi:hypothetical protein
VTASLASLILAHLRAHGASTFPELTRALPPPFDHGDTALVLDGHDNIVLWPALQPDVVVALKALRRAGMIHVRPVEWMTVAESGEMPALPVATCLSHRTPHWAPVVLFATKRA